MREKRKEILNEIQLILRISSVFFPPLWQSTVAENMSNRICCCATFRDMLTHALSGMNISIDRKRIVRATTEYQCHIYSKLSCEASRSFFCCFLFHALVLLFATLRNIYIISIKLRLCHSNFNTCQFIVCWLSVCLSLLRTALFFPTVVNWLLVLA